MNSLQPIISIWVTEDFGPQSGALFLPVLLPCSTVYDGFVQVFWVKVTSEWSIGLLRVWKWSYPWHVSFLRCYYILQDHFICFLLYFLLLFKRTLLMLHRWHIMVSCDVIFSLHVGYCIKGMKEESHEVTNIMYSCIRLTSHGLGKKASDEEFIWSWKQLSGTQHLQCCVSQSLKALISCGLILRSWWIPS